MTKVVLTLNAGSSSLKFAAFSGANGGAITLLASGQIEGLGATAKGSVKSSGTARRPISTSSARSSASIM